MNAQTANDIQTPSTSFFHNFHTKVLAQLEVLVMLSLVILVSCLVAKPPMVRVRCGW